MNNISYDYYRIFYYVAKYKSLSGAAEILHSNQPNITKFMNRLEEQLGCKLMLRSNKGIRLTPEGEKLYKHVDIAHHQLCEAEEELLSDSSLSSGTIRIGATETALHGILLNKLAQFRADYPGIRLAITNYSTPQAISALRKGSVDFSIVTTPTDTLTDLTETRLLHFREIPVAASDSIYAVQKQLSPDELVKYPVIGLGAHSKTYEFYSNIFFKYGIEWQPQIDAATADQILPMIKAGLGIGFIPDFMAQEALEQNSITQLSIQDLTFERSLVLIEDKSRMLNAAAETFKKILFKKKENP